MSAAGDAVPSPNRRATAELGPLGGTAPGRVPWVGDRVSDRKQNGRGGETTTGPVADLPRRQMVLRRKRRGSDARLRHLPPGSVAIAGAPPRRLSGRSKRAAYHTPRRRKLSPDQEAAIRRLAAAKSLRELAAEFGVSHETVRAVLRRGVTARCTRHASLRQGAGLPNRLNAHEPTSEPGQGGRNGAQLHGCSLTKGAAC